MWGGLHGYWDAEHLVCKIWISVALASSIVFEYWVGEWDLA